jgi:phosphonate transport system substrate-binding protein
MIKKLFILSALAGASQLAMAQDACPNHGDLDKLYCDANKDLLADTPTDPAKLKDPSTIVFTYTPVEDPAKYENAFKPFTDYLGQCLAKKVIFYQVQNNAAEIEAMRSGRLHVAGFSTGPTVFAVNKAGAIPFAVKGDAKGLQGYNLITIVKASSPYKTRGRPQGQESGAHRTIEQFWSPRTGCALLPGSGLDTRQGLRNQVLGQA